jgi:hypothetical protein
MGGPTSGRRSVSSTPGYPAPHRRRCQGEAATRFQWSRREPGCSGNASPRDAGAVNHRGATYLGRAQESPGGRRGLTGRKLRLSKAGVPLETSRRDFPIHAGSLDPHRAHAQHSACGPRSPRQRAPSPRPSGPPRREGAPRLPPQAWGMLRQRGRIGVPRPKHPVCRLSAAPYDGRRSRPGSDPRLLSQSTRGRRDQNCGSRTTGWPSNWVERTTTTSSSATSPCSSPTPLAPGWSTCLRCRSPTGTTWSKPSPAISRARTCALGTPGTFEAADSSRESLSGTTSGDSRSSAPSCPTSPIQMSSARSSPAPLAATWSASWVERPPPGRAS